MLRTVRATRYVTPLREGGSLPAIVEADDDGMYVVKFRGAGQGPKALIAEMVGGEIGRALGLTVPELVFIEIDPDLARGEPDQDIQDLLKASAGLNLALDYLPGSVTFDALSIRNNNRPKAANLQSLLADIDPLLASSVVWFDAFITNVDRTPRNTNMLLWHKRVWLIDHGASLIFHHAWADYLTRSRTPFGPIKDHVLLPYAAELTQADATLRPRLSRTLFEELIGLIPAAWLDPAQAGFEDDAAQRAAYVAYLESRLEAAPIFLEEALHARAQLV